MMVRTSRAVIRRSRCSRRELEGDAMNVHLAVVLAALPAAALAQQEARTGTQAPSSAEHLSIPELDGHVFAPSLLVETPFRMTTFKLGLLYGAGKATGPQYDASGNVVGQAEYTFGALAQTFRYE